MKDPVYGMDVTPQSAHAHLGQSFYFCCAGCKIKFAADPLKYLAPAAASLPAPVAGAIYTSPMHPEVQQDHPGSCPHCGMAMEPEMPSLDDAENPELVDFRRRFWRTLPFSVAVMALAMPGHRLQWFDMQVQS